MENVMSWINKIRDGFVQLGPDVGTIALPMPLFFSDKKEDENEYDDSTDEDLTDEEDDSTDEDDDDGDDKKKPIKKTKYDSLTPAEMAKMLSAKDEKISSLNSESATRRRKLKAFEETQRELDRKDMDALEAAKDRLTELEEKHKSLLAENQTILVGQAVRREVLTVDEVDYILIDPDDFKLPESKNVEDVPKLLAELMTTKPHYFKKKDPQETEEHGTPKGKVKAGKKGTSKKIDLPRQKL